VKSIDAGSSGKNDAQKGDKDALSFSHPAPKAPEISPLDLPVPASKKSEAAPDLEQKRGSCQGARSKRPLDVYVVRDEESSTFEKRTILLGVVSLGIAALSLSAAIIAGFLVYHQWWEMNAQTGYMNRAALQARTDSATSERATAAQLALMQGQLTQQQEAFKATERARVALKFEQAGKVIDESKTMFSLENSGLTSARNLRFGHRIVGILDGKWTKETLGRGFLEHWPWFAPRVLGPSSEYPIPPPLSPWPTRDLLGGQLLDWDYIGRVEYDDVFGLHHWFTFCYIRREDGTIGACPYGNEEDQSTDYLRPPPAPPRHAP
jgi:hypothetical protein